MELVLPPAQHAVLFYKVLFSDDSVESSNERIAFHTGMEVNRVRLCESKLEGMGLLPWPQDVPIKDPP